MRDPSQQLRRPVLQRALNQMTAPGIELVPFLDLAFDTGCCGVELRTDLGGRLFGGMAAKQVRGEIAARDLRLLALSELAGFDDWTMSSERRAIDLARRAEACGAEGIALIPRNDLPAPGGTGVLDGLRRALLGLAPILSDHGLTGLIEPLGFATASLRDKAGIVAVLDEMGLADRFRLIHDTFHHALAGGGPVFAAHTALVHISGVADPRLAAGDMRDPDRGLVDSADRLDTVGQIAVLARHGYDGPLSVEAFAPEVHALGDPRAALTASFDHIFAARPVGRPYQNTPLKSGAPA